MAEFWKSEIVSQLHFRDRTQHDSLRPVFEAYDRLLRSEKQLRNRVQQLENEAKSSATATVVDPSTGKRLSSDGAVAALQEKLNQKQEELNAAYRVNAENTQSLLRAKEQHEEDERAILSKEEELQNKRTELHSALEGAAKEHARTTELENSISLLTKEIESLREAKRVLEDKMKNLEDENSALVQKIIKIGTMQNQEALRMGEMLAQVQRERMGAGSPAAGSTSSSTSAASSSSSSATATSIFTKDQRIAADIDLTNQAAILDAATWQSNFNVVVPTAPKRAFLAHKGQASCIRFNSSGTLLASGGSDAFVRIWDTRACSKRGELRAGNKSAILCVAFPAKDSLIAATSLDGVGRVWSMDTSRLVHTLTGHTGKVYACAFSSDAEKLITGSYDRTLRLWDMSNGYCTRTTMCGSSCNYVALSPNDDLFASAHLDCHVRLWSMRSGEAICDLADLHSQQVTCAEFSRDATQVVTNSRDNTLKIIDCRTFKVLKTLTGDFKVQYRNAINWNRATFSPDGQYVLAGAATGSVFVWNVFSGKLEVVLNTDGTNALAPTPATTSTTSPLSFAATTASSSAASSSTATSSSSNSTSTTPADVGIPSTAITSVAWNRNGRQFASCDYSGKITFWE